MESVFKSAPLFFSVLALAFVSCERELDETRDITPIINDGAPYSEKERMILHQWKLKTGGLPRPEVNERELVREIREKILKKAKSASFASYTATVPETGAKFEMISIEGGIFTMGSPPDEPGRFEDEGPQHQVQVSSFWMGKYEVTWTEFEPFMITNVSRSPDGYPNSIHMHNQLNDWSSSPTTPYTEMSMGMGNGPKYPAVNMTQHSANKYCQWLSAQTGHFYRLPTEAEWEYACRAGTTSAFSCDESSIQDHAIIDPEQIRTKYARVGRLKPNPFGLYDMHGNVMEWTLDAYVADIYQDRVYDGVTVDPWVKPTQLYPRVARGGSWYDHASECRSARRIFSTPDWKVQDPQLPKSIWYHTDAPWLGFRLVRAVEIPSEDEMYEMWNLGDMKHKDGDIVPTP